MTCRSNSTIFSPLVQPFKIWASAYGRGQLIFGDAEGFIITVNQKLESFPFRAYMLRVTHLYMMKQQNILVSVGVSRNFLQWWSTGSENFFYYVLSLCFLGRQARNGTSHQSVEPGQGICR